MDRRPPPASCFWELTRRCELRCLHCRSPEEAAASEPSLDQALSVADQLVELGVELVVLTGGEPTLAPWWEKAAARLVRGGVRLRLLTNGFAASPQVVEACVRAGVAEVALSLDGPAEVHDHLRPSPAGISSFARAVETARLVVEARVPLRLVTQLNRLNAGRLRETARLAADLEARRWQVQLVQMSGRAREHRSQLAPHPAALEELVEVLLELARRRREGELQRPEAPLHCTAGYMVAEEAALRGRCGGRAFWRGCPAGLASVAITAGGGVKGCAALPDAFVTASLDDRPLADIWQDDDCFPYTRRWSPRLLEGECARCALSEVCRGGCPAVAYGATGSVGANPYCLRLLRRRDC